MLEQEIQQCKQDVERLMKEQLANIAQTSRVPRTPSQPSQVPAESRPGSVARSHKSMSSRESCTRAPADLGSSHVIDARPLSQAPDEPFRFATPSHLTQLVATQSQGGGRSKAKGDPRTVKVLSEIFKGDSQVPFTGFG